ncbi:MAG: tetratricopeptide repeat protein, partial [Mariprofundaceae bacterium]
MDSETLQTIEGDNNTQVKTDSGDVNITVNSPSTEYMPLDYPERAEHFTGRADELKQLLAEIRPGHVAALCGPGGMGKTGLMAEAVWATAPDNKAPILFPDGIFLHSFYNQPSAEVALESIARAFTGKCIGNPLDAARHALSGKTALLILDGTEEADNLRSVLSIRSNCGVIVTSREQRDAPDTAIKLKPMLEKDAILLLQAWAEEQSHDETSVQEICRIVGRLPLAVRLVGRYLAQQNEDAAIYLQWLQQQPLEALNPNDEEHKLDSVPYLIKRSLEQVSAEARDLLALVGQLAMSPFDAEVIRHSMELSIGATKKAISPLVNYGLLNKPENRYQISHALIHTFARQELPLQKEAWQRLVNWYIERTNTESSNGVKGFQTLDQDRAHLLRLVEGCEQAQEWKTLISLVQSMDSYLDKQGYWIERAQLLRQGLTIAITTKDKGEEGWFYAQLGHCCIHQCDYNTALDYLNKSLAISQEIGDKSGEGTTLNNISQIYDARVYYETALDYLNKSLAIQQEIGDIPGL